MSCADYGVLPNSEVSWYWEADEGEEGNQRLHNGIITDIQSLPDSGHIATIIEDGTNRVEYVAVICIDSYVDSKGMLQRGSPVPAAKHHP